MDYPGEWLLTCRCWRRMIKLVAPDDGLTQWSARRMVGEMANDERRAGPASACLNPNRLADIAAAC
ncbi:hypothetical protein ACLB1O_10885 [Escherichia coli]